MASLSGVLSKEERASPPPFDIRSWPTYAALLAMVAIAWLSALFAGFSAPAPAFIYGAAALSLFILGMAYLFRFSGWPRLASAVETVILWLVLGYVTCLALIPLTALSGPLQDKRLISWDLALGYDWLPAFRTVSSVPWLMDILRLAYHSFAVESVGILAALCLLRREERAWRALSATGASLIITLLIYPFFPANAAYGHFGIHYADNFASIIHEIKAGSRVISVEHMGGLVTFPSFHVTAAVIAAWAGWAFKPIRWPLVVVNLVVSVSAIFIGAHYLVDVLAGALVAVVGVAIAAVAQTRWSPRH